MKKSLILVLVLALVVAMVFTGCDTSETVDDSAAVDDSATVDDSEVADEEVADDSEAADEEVADEEVVEEDLRLAIFMLKNANEFTLSVSSGAAARGEELGIEVTVFDANGDQAVQINQIETCITQGYDGLMIEPVTVDGIGSVLELADSQGIPVITVIQTCAQQDDIASFVGADHNAAAKVQMQACMDAIGGEGKICICEGSPGSTGHIIIDEGFYEILDQYPDVEVIETQDCEWLIDTALSTVETWLQLHDDIDAIIAENGPMALGAAKACEDKGVEGVYINGRDAVTGELEAILAGTQSATIWQCGPEMGATAVDVIIKLINGESVEKEYMMDNIVVDQSNAQYYLDLRNSMS